MIVLPMAGRSSRFAKAGFTQPKYRLPLGPEQGGMSLFRACLESFKAYFAQESFVFVHLDEPEVRAFLREQVALAGLAADNCHYVALGEPTTGQAETVALGLERAGLNLSNPLFIFNIDTIRTGFQKPEFIKDPSVAGYLEVMRAEGDHWSFARVDDIGYVVEVAEKSRISDLCSTGLYYFRSAEDYLAAYRASLHQSAAQSQGGERYVAPLYNWFIAQGAQIRVAEIAAEEVAFSGTPEEYWALLRSETCQ